MDCPNLYFLHGLPKLILSAWIAKTYTFYINCQHLYLLHGLPKLILSAWIAKSYTFCMDCQILYFLHKLPKHILSAWIAKSYTFCMNCQKRFPSPRVTARYQIFNIFSYFVFELNIPNIYCASYSMTTMAKKVIYKSI